MIYMNGLAKVSLMKAGQEIIELTVGHHGKCVDVSYNANTGEYDFVGTSPSCGTSSKRESFGCSVTEEFLKQNCENSIYDKNKRGMKVGQ